MQKDMGLVVLTKGSKKVLFLFFLCVCSSADQVQAGVGRDPQRSPWRGRIHSERVVCCPRDSVPAQPAESYSKVRLLQDYKERAARAEADMSQMLYLSALFAP